MRIYSRELRLIFSILVLLLFYLSNRRRSDFFQKIKFIFFTLSLSIIASTILAIIFGNSEYWYLKYSIGLIVGIFTRTLAENLSRKFIGIIASIISFCTLLTCESIEYYVSMDPSDYPSIYNIDSFLEPLYWYSTIAIVIISALVIATLYKKKGNSPASASL